MQTQFALTVSYDLRGISSEVADMEDSINKSMKGFGFDEKLVIRQTRRMLITIGKDVTKEEEIGLRPHLEGALLKGFKGCNPKIERFERV